MGARKQLQQLLLQLLLQLGIVLVLMHAAAAVEVDGHAAGSGLTEEEAAAAAPMEEGVSHEFGALNTLLLVIVLGALLFGWAERCYT